MFRFRFLASTVIVFILTQSLFCQISTDKQWPSFRGLNASGVMDNADLPDAWNIKENINLKWKTPIPGLGHSCPIIWDDYLFVTTAMSGNENEFLKVGLYGDIDPLEDSTVHQFRVYCLDKNNGKIIWDRLAHEGVPRTKRHPKASHANPTPATNGKYIVAFFGSDGLYCYDFKGKLIWSKDLGTLNAGPYTDPDVEWGFASSPIIYDGKVIVQCDFLGESFLTSFEVATGKEVWRTMRDEISTWSSPTIIDVDGKAQIIVNGYKHIGAYDFETGKEIWWMQGGGDAPVPTPVFSHNLIFINSAHGKMSPIYAIKPDAIGDITLGEEETSNKYIIWSIKRGGAYMTSPLVYGDYLYNLVNNGLLSCFNARTGELMYKEPLKPGGGISASGIASDGKLFFTSELGDVFVVEAGPVYKLIAKNPLGDICMSTPAISNCTLYFRTQHYVMAVAEN
ncbi:MAG: pyrrolo-quinoline quinone [Bacteroidetes bacterium HGW-Bacteroidetes-17]|jgi:outer membrane protein assembly factor BamB|nr:MAG: pyrrolo-quinoline quinone [Bacteroidetes bacterium HGW-Bacteroidetes-17]